MLGDVRQYPRLVSDSPVSVRVGESNSGLLFDLSEGGLAVDGLAAETRDGAISVAFDLPEGKDHIQARAEIAWTSDSGHRTGLRFVELADASRRQLMDWVFARASSVSIPAYNPSASRRHPMEGALKRLLEELNTSTAFLWTIVCWGALLRLTQYLANRSLWLDESTLALNIVNRSFSQLLKPLDYNQGAPIGFLMLERSVVHVFGTSEYALRLFPLFCAIISLLLFYRIARLCVAPKAVPIALGLFAISGPLIYFSSEVKQYSSDVAIAILLLSAAIYYDSHKFTPWRVAIFGLIGAVSIWFSHPSVFILAGVGMTLTFFSLAERRWARIGNLSIVFSLWALSLVACYLISLRHLSNNKNLLNHWASGFVPSPLLSLATVEWFINAFFGIFRGPVGLGLSGIAALTFLVGCISMFSNKRERLYLLISPILFTLLAAAFHKYPFEGRLLLFAVPSLLLCIAEGAEQIRRRTWGETRIGACLIGLLFFYPFLLASYHLVKPISREEIKPVFNYVKEHARDQDVLCIYYAAKPAFRYYAPRFSLDKMNLVQMSDNWSNDTAIYERDIDQLRGYKRVWLLFSHSHTDDSFDEERLLLSLFDRAGTRLDYFKSAGAAVYLYDLD